MKKFDAYVQEANRLCDKVLAESNDGIASQRLLHMQEKISRYELTMYQKYFLLQQLSATREIMHAQNESIIQNGTRTEHNEYCL